MNQICAQMVKGGSKFEDSRENWKGVEIKGNEEQKKWL